MDKIKSVLSGHRKGEDVTQDTPESSTGQSHPIFDEMTGQKGSEQKAVGQDEAIAHDKPVELGKEGTLTEAGGPYSQVHTTSGEPYTALAQPGVMGHADTTTPVTGSETTTGEHLGNSSTVTGEHLGTSSTTTGEPVASSEMTSTDPLGTSHAATESHLDGSNTTTGEHLGSSATTSSAPIGTAATTSGGNLHSDISPAGNESVHTEISRASIKSGVIGFGPSETHTHAALPTNFTDEQNLHRDQVVGGGNMGPDESRTPGEVQQAADSQALPHSRTTTQEPHEEHHLGRDAAIIGGTGAAAGLGAHEVSKAHEEKPVDQSLRQESYTTDTDRSFPLAGGVTAKDTGAAASHQQTSTGGQEPFAKEESTTADKERSIPVIGGLVSKLTHKDKDHEHAPAHHETTTTAQEPVAQEKETTSTNKERSIPLIGGLLAKLSSKDKDKETQTEHTSAHHDKTVSESAPVIKESETDTHAKHKKEGEALLAAGAVGGVVGDVASKKHEEQTTQHEQIAPTQPSTSVVEPVPVTEESPVIGKDQSLPVAGAVTSKHENLTPATHETSSIEPVPVSRGVTSGPEEPVPTPHHAGATEQEPVTKESSSTEKERSIPLVGGLLSRFTSKKDKEDTPAHDEKAIGEQEPVAKQTESADTHRSVPVVGALLSKLKSDDKEHVTTQPEKTTSERELGTKDKEVGAHDGHSKEALAAAAAAATAAKVSRAQPHSEAREVPLASSHINPTPTDTTGSTTMAPSSQTTSVPLAGAVTSKIDSTTPHHNPEALAAATAAAAAAASRSSTTHESVRSTPDKTLPITSSTIPTSQPTSAPLATGATTDQTSHQHIPGEFPSATPVHDSKTFLDSRLDPEVAPGTATSGTTSELPSHITPGVTSGMDATTGQHEFRHTGSLEQPISKSSDLPSEHHYGRDAALASGLVAGAAGVGHLASEKRDTTATDSKPLYEESSPYSSKTLDPRVMGTKAPVAEQTIEPQSTSETLPHHAAETSNPAGIAASSDPAAAHLPTEAEDSQHHLGRDAALVGGGAATASALRPTALRNDTPGTGTFILPPETSETPALPSTSITPQESSSTSAPLTTSAAPVSQQHSTVGDTFHDAASTPAPLADKSSTLQPSSNLGHTTDSTTTGPLKSDSNVPQKDSEHHLGRDAALVGAGAATAAGLSSASHDNKADTGPASKTIGPHDSDIANILDPRVQPDPALQKDQTTSGPHKSDLLNKLDPRVDEKAEKKEEHHYGRDAAIIGGTGAAAGLGAHEVAKAHEEHQGTQLETSMTEPRHEATTTESNISHPVPTTSQFGDNTTGTVHPVDHSAALGTGAGLGAATAGAATYEGIKHAENTRDLPIHQTHDTATTGQPGGVTQPGYIQDTSIPHTTHESAGHQRYDSVIDPSNQHHDKRDAALLGATGAAVAGGAVHEHSKHEEAERERERVHLEKEQEKVAKKEAHDQEKEAHRLEKEQHKHDKEIAAAQHKQEKEAHKLQKEQHKHEKEEIKREKAEEKEQHRLEKEELKREKAGEKEAHRLEKTEEGEKMGGIFGFLHRDKSKKEQTSRESSPNRSAEHAAAGTAGAVAAGTAVAHHHEDDDPNSPRWKGKNLLHKDPPPGHPAREAMEHQGKREHTGTDGPIGHPDLISGDRPTKPGVFGGHPIFEPSHSDSAVEPQSGSIMNVDKVGTGVGATDGNTAVSGHHPVADTGTGTGPDIGKHANLEVEGHHHMPGTTTGTTTGVGSEGVPTTTGQTTTEREGI